MSKPQGALYKRTILQQTDFFEIVACEWGKDDISPLHDHGFSQCYTLVQEGTFENLTDFGLKKELTLKESGQVIITPVGSKHEIKCLSKTGKTFHVYTPKLAEKKPTPLFQTLSNADLSKSINLQLQPKGLAWEKLVALLQAVADQSVSTNSVYFMNQLFSGVTSQMLAAEDLIAKTKASMATFEASSVLNLIEIEVVQNLCRQIGWLNSTSSTADGIQVPGGSSANFMALQCARHKKNPNYKINGLPANTKYKIFGSKESHYSLQKACVVMGLGLNALVQVNTDSDGKMSLQDLEFKIGKSISAGETPLIVYATAGTTVLGAFDPIPEIAKICQKNNIWLHVDAAWGGPALFSKKLRHHIQGSELADSWTFDAHKFYGAGLTCAFFLTQHTQTLFEANDVKGGEYLFHETENFDRGRLSWQCGRRADAVSFWTLWKSLGTEGLTQFIDDTLDLRDKLTVWIKDQPRLNLITEPDFLNVCVQVLPPKDLNSSEELIKSWSNKIRQNIKNKNLTLVNYSATADSTSFLRLILAHPFLKIEDLKNILTWAIEEE
ncbi:MAG: aminotransferase class V-fold PLP-dependent enzyme [Pseudobdellovibrionaceae bacterium]